MVAIQWRGQSEEDDLDLGDPSLAATAKGFYIIKAFIKMSLEIVKQLIVMRKTKTA